MLLSVIIPTTPRRLPEPLGRIVHELDRQMSERDDCEVIALLDNERMSIGEKLNMGYQVARGKFCSVVADDDFVSEDYVRALLDTIEAQPQADVICFPCEYYVDGKHVGFVYESKDFDHEDSVGVYRRKPSDKMCWSRRFLLEHPHINTWETSDTEFSRRVWDKIRYEAQIDHAIYKFYYVPKKPEGQRYRMNLDERYRGLAREDR